MGAKKMGRDGSQHCGRRVAERRDNGEKGWLRRLPLAFKWVKRGTKEIGLQIVDERREKIGRQEVWSLRDARVVGKVADGWWRKNGLRFGLLSEAAKKKKERAAKVANSGGRGGEDGQVGWVNEMVIGWTGARDGDGEDGAHETALGYAMRTATGRM
ncbi:hypothetical protein AMTR_s00167p00041230 [Amborella trichopoda]|uniref:Uncharacterized protein n=1 Tax=Amborella trichopoda TaxID=13333 RepID=W1PLJ5_AMBTC|nr:hypothetical protein AMTR_s00167p00041230 [Amborella trichopoda]